jgi:peptidoglycan-associated lipoprotein
MKITKFAEPIILGLLLSLATPGCKHHEPPITHFDDKKGSLRGPGPGGTIGDGPGVSTLSDEAIASGLKAGPGHPGWNKDRETFQADTVHFAYDSSVIRAEDKSKVAAVADYLKGNPGAAVEIEGHCDERGTDEYNRALGERRALALREEVARLGIDPNRVDTISYGRDRRVDMGSTEAAHRKNRRGEFVLLTPPK